MISAGRFGNPAATSALILPNLLTKTELFDNAAWSKTNITVTANSTAAPDGAATADTLTASVTGSTHATQAATIAAASTNTFSVYVKPSTTNWARLRMIGGANTNIVYFNLATGVVGTATAPGAEITAFSGGIEAAANGFYRIRAVVTTATVTSLSCGVGPCASDGSGGALNDSCFAWGAMLNTGSVPALYAAVA